MDALKMLQGTTHSQSAGAPSSRLRRFHLPHWKSLLKHSGFYKGLINIVSTIVYIHVPLNRSILPQPLRPKPGLRLKYLRGQSRGFVLLEKGTGAAEIMLYQPCIARARMETRPAKEHARSACVWSPNPEELQGKRRDRPKRYVTALHHLTNARDLFNFRQTTRTNKALGSNSG